MGCKIEGMASYHCTVKAGAPGNGGAHSDYIERSGRYKTKAGKDRDDVEAVESGNMPAWADSSAAFWKASDVHERVNAAGYREYEVALPREMTPAQRLDLVRDFVRQELGDRHAFTFAIHNPRASIEGGEQPHAHIMFSERVLDGIERLTPEHYFKRANSKKPETGGLKKANGARKTDAERKAELVDLRGRWADLQNKHLARVGAIDRVDHRSHADRGIERPPEQHLGPRQIHAGSGLARAVVDARATHREASQADRDLRGARRRVDRLVALQSGRKTRHSRQVEKLPTLAQAEAAAEKVVEAWKQCLYAEREGYVAEAVLKALRALQGHLKQVEAHQGTKPLIFGRQAWEKQLAALDKRTRLLEVTHRQLQARDSYAIERLNGEADRRAEAKNPELARAYAEARETLLARDRKKSEAAMAKMRAEHAAKQAKRLDKGRSR